MSTARFDAANLPSIPVEGRAVPVLVRRYARARRFRLRYDAINGLLRLSIPARAKERAALDWACDQADWVARQLQSAPTALRLVPGASVPVEGVERRIVWDRAHSRTPALSAEQLQVGGPEPSVGNRLVRWLRSHALDVLRAETLAIATEAGLAVASVDVGDPRSRWGSCSSAGAIRYSWRLILAPPEVRRATVTHELAHLLHMDHSPAFHAAHRRLLGTDPAPAREWLRAHGAALRGITA